jgi:hypothetical protein
MKKHHLLVVLFVCLSLALFSFASHKQHTVVLGQTDTTAAAADSSVAVDSVQMITDSISDRINIDSLGLSKEAIAYAVRGYQELNSAGRVDNPYLTIVDLSQSSRKKRFYIIDMENDSLVWNTFVAHGKNSGLDEATRFSNATNSEESSLGFYLTGSTYTGKHGLSLRISGQEKGFNDNAEARGIVVHGASYVNAARANSSYMGRSQGCPALPEHEYAQVIRMIKEGSVLFVYHPSTEYLQNSPVLNS